MKLCQHGFLCVFPESIRSLSAPKPSRDFLHEAHDRAQNISTIPYDCEDAISIAIGFVHKEMHKRDVRVSHFREYEFFAGPRGG